MCIKKCILCLCDKFAVSPEKYHLKDKKCVFSILSQLIDENVNVTQDA